MTDGNTTPIFDGTPESVSAQAIPAQPVFTHPQPSPVYIVQQAPATKKGFGIASMVLGISAVIFSWTAVFGFILLLASFVFGTVSLVKKETPRGFAITGIVLGSVAVILVIIIVAVLASLAAAFTVTNSGY